MTAIWTYPWNLYEEGVDRALEDLASRGIDAITLPSHYHSVQTLQPRFTDSLFEQYPGGCYVEPAPERFAELPIKPPVNQVGGLDDPFGDIADVARDHGIAVNAWQVCFHNSRLGADYPEYRIESALGDAHDHSFCPSHPEVQEYFAAVVAETVKRNVSEIQLESIGFPTVFHGHGANFGHSKRQVLTTDTEEWLLSQCFCDACSARAAERGVNVERAREMVTDLLQDSFNNPHSTPAPLAALVREYPILDDLFEFRATVVSEFVERLAEAAGDVPLSTYVGKPGVNWPAGIRLQELQAELDRVTAVCYVGDPGEAKAQVQTLKRTVSLPVDAVIYLNPEFVGSESDFQVLVNAVRSEVDGELGVYHHGLATNEQLDWIEQVMG